eukprot:1161664-Pelagomonas_calceolata.AAC.3
MVVCSGSCMHCKEQTAFGHSTLFWCGPLQLLLATDFAQTQGADAKAYRHSYDATTSCTDMKEKHGLKQGYKDQGHDEQHKEGHKKIRTILRGRLSYPGAFHTGKSLL